MSGGPGQILPEEGCSLVIVTDASGVLTTIAASCATRSKGFSAWMPGTPACRAATGPGTTSAFI
jgi:hypothetical protein